MKITGTGIQIPEPLLTELRNGRLVVFAGAGVSMGEPARLPSFSVLANQIAAGTGVAKDADEPEDRFLGRLQHAGVDVHQRAVTELLRGDPAPTPLHSALLRLYRDVGDVRVVTTNFDLLFEKAVPDVFASMPEVFRAPALPLGRDYQGIVHVHGVVDRPREIVLTDTDFGRAYLTEGWARRFLVELFRHYPVLFVGYRHADTIVSYLARALPESNPGQRFALIPELEDDPQRWRVLGIEPIVYPQQQPYDYQALTIGIQELAKLIQRNVFDWQREITAIARNAPPFDDETADIIESALKEVTTTRFFTESARSPEWIAWLNKRKHVDALFAAHTILSERDKVLAQWLAEQFAIQHSDALFLLIAEHRMTIQSEFWYNIITALTFRAVDPPDEKTLSRWVSMLIVTMPKDVASDQLLYLAERCMKQGMIPSALSIIDVLAAGNLVIQRGIAWPTDLGLPSSDLSIDVMLRSNSSILQEVWKEHIKPHLSQLAEPLLAIAVRRLEEQHFMLRAWQKAHEKEDGFSFGRSAIEPHEQDRHPRPIDALINMARDCFEWLTIHDVPAAASWCDRLGSSTVPLLRRLAIHALARRSDLSADEKIQWILRRMGLYDTTAHHELYQTMRHVYPEAGDEQRAAVIEAILCYRWSYPEDDGSEEERTAYRHFRWLHWLSTSAPECRLTLQALNAITEQHPEFKPAGDYPDLTHHIHVGEWEGPQSPLSVEDLLSKPAAEWLPELMTVGLSHQERSSRPPLLQVVARAASQELKWGLDLATALAEQQSWEIDLWESLIRGWTWKDLDEGEYRRILYWFDRLELYPHHVYVLAEALSALVEKDGKPYALALLPEANRIATALSPYAAQVEIEQPNNWLEAAINHPAGILTEFWLKSLSLWRHHQDHKPLALNDEYRQTLTRIVQDPTPAGRLGRACVAGNLAFLLSVDEGWTRTHVVPLFDIQKDIVEAQAAWDGFLVFGRLNPTVVDCLAPACHATMRRLERDLPGRSKRFVECYTTISVLFAEDPLNEWIPELFQAGGAEVRRYFASNISEHLQNLDEQSQTEWWRRWLKQYWQNRLQGVPARLEPEEVETMLSWLPKLTGVFPEAVELAIQMPSGSLQHGTLLYTLRTGDFANRFPEASARLLIYLGTFNSPFHIWYGAGEMVNQLLEAPVSAQLEQGLRELIIRHQLS